MIFDSIFLNISNTFPSMLLGIKKKKFLKVLFQKYIGNCYELINVYISNLFNSQKSNLNSKSGMIFLII